MSEYPKVIEFNGIPTCFGMQAGKQYDIARSEQEEKQIMELRNLRMEDAAKADELVFQYFAKQLCPSKS
jgi:hypothetical protein